MNGRLGLSIGLGLSSLGVISQSREISSNTNHQPQLDCRSSLIMRQKSCLTLACRQRGGGRELLPPRRLPSAPSTAREGALEIHFRRLLLLHCQASEDRPKNGTTDIYGQSVPGETARTVHSAVSIGGLFLGSKALCALF